MDTQFVINLAMAIIGFLGGFILKALWDSIRELKADNKNLTAKIQSIETLVAGQYVRREEFNHVIELMTVKLDTINLNISARFEAMTAKIENKQDRNIPEGMYVAPDRRKQ